MRGVLVDTGPLVAVIDADDAFHDRCVQALKEIREPLFAVWPVISEAMHLVGALAAQERLWDVLEEGRLQLLPLETADMSRMRALMKKYSDLPMDLADAALVRVAERGDCTRSSPSIRRTSMCTACRAAGGSGCCRERPAGPKGPALLLKQRNAREGRRSRARLQVRVDVRQVAVGNDLLRVRWHLVRRAPDVRREPREGEVPASQPRTRGAALTFVPVALPAADADPQLLARFRVSGGRCWCLRGRLRRRPGTRDGGNQHQRCNKYRRFHMRHRGCVTTSTSAGSPFFTTASARWSAGPRSFAFAIGPSA